jgi:HEAT repeat protein
MQPRLLREIEWSLERLDETAKTHVQRLAVILADLEQADQSELRVALLAALPHIIVASENLDDTSFNIAELGVRAVPAIAELLQSKPDFYLSVILRVGPGAKDTLPLVLQYAREDCDARECAVSALGSIRHYDEKVEECLRSILEIDRVPAKSAMSSAFASDRDLLLLNAIETTGKLAPNSKRLIPALAELMSDASFQYRQCAASAIGEFREEGAAALPKLVFGLRSRNTELRVACGEALAKSGRDAQFFLPLLAQIVRDERDPDAAERLVRALKSLSNTAPSFQVPDGPVTYVDYELDPDDVALIRTRCQELLSGSKEKKLQAAQRLYSIARYNYHWDRSSMVPQVVRAFGDPDLAMWPVNILTALKTDAAEAVVPIAEYIEKTREWDIIPHLPSFGIPACAILEYLRRWRKVSGPDLEKLENVIMTLERFATIKS